MRKAEYRDIVILLRATTNYADSFVAELSARNIPVFADVNSGYFDKMEVQIGSRYKNALWEELGTGIYALNGDGRKTKWVYRTEDGKFHATVGKKPRRALYRAYESKKNAIIREAKRRFKEL